jgi:hypothetical protein
VSKDNRLSNQKVRMTQIVNGKWTLISEYLEPVDVAK